MANNIAQDFQLGLAELMTKFDEYKAKWEAEHGTLEGFNAWFTAQVVKV
jgi:hypothetical protein